MEAGTGEKGTSMNKQTILIVDDDKEIVRSLEENISLLPASYNVKTSFEGKNALEILEKETIDLMILDIQMPDMNGFQLLTELRDKGIWLPIIIVSDKAIDEKNKELKQFGIIDSFKKPFLPERIVIDIDDIIKNRGKTDLIKNIGLHTIMQVIEMEKKTGILTVKIGAENGRIFFKDGNLMDIEVKGLSTKEALRECMNSLYEDREISIEYINHRKEQKINMSLMQIAMEASRIKDEKKISPASPAPGGQNKKLSKNEHISLITNLLNSLKEVESYIIADTEGEVLSSSSENYKEEILNSSLYLWVIGTHLGAEFKMGAPTGLVYYRKARKRLLHEFQDYVMILDLMEITKFSAFKKKLPALLSKLVLE